jgi:hypothetical protein
MPPLNCVSVEDKKADESGGYHFWVGSLCERFFQDLFLGSPLPRSNSQKLVVTSLIKQVLIPPPPSSPYVTGRWEMFFYHSDKMYSIFSGATTFLNSYFRILHLLLIMCTLFVYNSLNCVSFYVAVSTVHQLPIMYLYLIMHVDQSWILVSKRAKTPDCVALFWNWISSRA